MPEEPATEVTVETYKLEAGDIVIDPLVYITVKDTSVENAERFKVYYEVDVNGEVVKVTEPENRLAEFGENIAIPKILIGKEVTIKLFDQDGKHLGDYKVIVPEIKAQ